MLQTVLLSVFDHDAERGYHFRSHSGDPAWDDLLRAENEAVRNLADEEVPQRMHIVPMPSGDLVAMASIRIRSDGRSAVRTASLKVPFEGVSLSWPSGLEHLVRQALNSKALGGSLSVVLNPEPVPSGLLEMLPPPDLNLNMVEIEGTTLSTVMYQWSMLCPNVRAHTEVIVGPVDPEQTAPVRRLFWHATESGGTGTSPFNSSHVHIPDSTRTRDGVTSALIQAAQTADTTGIVDSSWWSVVSSDMASRGLPLDHVDQTSIRLRLSREDVRADRRSIWRSMAIDAYNERGDHAVFWASGGGLLTPKELGALRPDLRIDAIAYACRAPLTQEHRQDLVASLPHYASLLATHEVEALAHVAPWGSLMNTSGLEVALAEVTRLHPSWLRASHSAWSKLALTDPLYGEAYVGLLARSGVMLSVQDDLPHLMELRIQGSVQDVEHAFWNAPRLLHAPSWDHEASLAYLIAGTHVQRLNEEDLLTCIEEYTQTLPSIFTNYASGLAAAFVSTPVPSSVASKMAPLDREGPWVATLALNSSPREARTTLREMDLKVDQLSISLLGQLVATTPVLNGLPPLGWKPTSEEDRIKMHARLHLAPTARQRLRSFLYAFSTFVPFWTACLFLLAGPTSQFLPAGWDAYVLALQHIIALPGVHFAHFALIGFAFGFLHHMRGTKKELTTTTSKEGRHEGP